MRRWVGFCLLLGALMVVMGLEFFYFQAYHSPNNVDTKRHAAFTRVLGLPDVALVSEAHSVRHRSLASTFSLFSESPSLLEYFPSTFVYAYSPTVKKTPSVMERP